LSQEELDMNEGPDLLVTTFSDLLDALQEVAYSDMEVFAVLAAMLTEGRVLVFEQRITLVP
jgi:hypothetical protein